MERFNRLQTSHSDAKPQKNKAKQETSSRPRLYGVALTGALLLGQAMGNAIPDLSRSEPAGSNLHLSESNNLTEYTSPPPLPEYLKELDHPSRHFVGSKHPLHSREEALDKKTAQPLNTTSDVDRIPQDKKFQGETSQLTTDNPSSSRKAKRAFRLREEALDKKTAQPLNTTSGVEHILQDKEFKKNIILACQKPESAKVCVALAKNQDVMKNFKQDEYFRNSLLSELGKDPELAKACITLAKDHEFINDFKQDEHCMKFLSELGQDPEFALTCVALAKNHKLLDNSYPPLNVTDVKGNLNVTQEKAHGHNSDTIQKNIEGQKGPRRKLFSTQAPEGEASTEKQPFTEKVADMLLQSQIPRRLTFNEMITEKQLSLTEKQLDHTNWRDNVYMTVTGGILVLAGITLFYNNRQLQKQCETLRSDKETLRNENVAVTRERDDLKRKNESLVDPKEFDAVKKEKEIAAMHNTALVQKSDALTRQIGDLEKNKNDAVQAGEKLLSENSRLKLLNENIEKEKQTLQENHQKELQRLKDDHQKELQRLKDDHQKELQRLKDDHQNLTNKFSTLDQNYRNLYTTYQQVQALIPPHERGKITQPLVSSTSASPAPPAPSLW